MFFDRDEFKCKCGCGENHICNLFIAQLEKARGIAGVPFVINSGYRCEKHNAAVGSKARNHPEGKAADIRAADNQTRGKILKGLYRAGFTRIGIYPTFIHADCMDDVESAWLGE